MEELRKQVSAELADLEALKARVYAEAHPSVRRLVLAAVDRAQGALADALATLLPPTESYVAIEKAERAGDWREVERLLGLAGERAKERARRAVLG